jgi:hypothetical protein
MDKLNAASLAVPACGRWLGSLQVTAAALIKSTKACLYQLYYGWDCHQEQENSRRLFDVLYRC